MRDDGEGSKLPSETVSAKGIKLQLDYLKRELNNMFRGSTTFFRNEDLRFPPETYYAGLSIIKAIAHMELHDFPKQKD